MATSTAPDGGFHHESMCVRAKPAHIPHDMLREVKVQIVRPHYPHSAHECVNQLEDLGGDRQTKNDVSQVCCRFPKGSCDVSHVSNVPPHFPHPKSQVSNEI